MRHILSTDMLEGFEHVSLLAASSKEPKSIEVETTLTEEFATTRFIVKYKKEIVLTTPSLLSAVKKYNDL